MVSNQKIRHAILRATDAKLRSDNWQYILDVCDLVRDDPEDGGAYAIEVIEERLGQPDANVILRTLSLVVSVAENCGSRLQQAISSKHFTTVLFDLVDSKTTHLIVKREVAKIVQQLKDSFKSDPSLKYIQDLYLKINSKAPYLLQQPNVPQKKEMNDDNKIREEKELEEALRLSLMEYSQKKEQEQTPVDYQSANQKETQESLPPTTQTIIKKVRAMYDLNAREPDELSFKKGDVITVIEQVYRDWWRGTLRGKVGIFPLNYVTPITEPTAEEITRELCEEQQVLGQKPNIERLQHVMRTSNGDVRITQSEEVNNLYGTVTPLRPQITKLIGKYAQKKEDLSSLRQILANAEATYNQLLDRAAHAYTPNLTQDPSAGNPGFTNPPYPIHQQSYLYPNPSPVQSQSGVPHGQAVNSFHYSQNSGLKANGRNENFKKGAYELPYPMSNQNTGL